MILQKTVGCEDNVSLGVRQEKVLGANKAAEGGAVEGSSLQESPEQVGHADMLAVTLPCF